MVAKIPDNGLNITDLAAADDFSLSSDSAVINFGADGEIKLTHVADTGLALKHTATADDKPIVLTLQTGETDMAANDVIGKIAFQAPDEGTGTDAILVSAAIQAVAEGDHSSSSNATKLSFMTGASEAAAEKMSLSSAGVLTLVGASTTGGTLTLENTDTGGAANDYFGKLIFKGNDSSSSASGTRASVEGKVTGNFGSSQLDFLTASGGAAAARIATLSPDGLSLADGNITFEGAGHGIHLGVTSATAANLLDDYEEGTYNVALTCGSGTATVSTDTQALNYTKIGRLVTVSGYIETNAASSPSGTLRINLPFTVPADTTARTEYGAVAQLFAVGSNNASTENGVSVAFVGGDGTNARIWRHAAATIQDDAAADLDSSCVFYFTFQYVTSA